MKNILFLLFTIITTAAFAQKKIITTGTIRFEGKVNMHKMLDGFGSNNPWAEEQKKRIPKYKITNYDLYFNTDESLFKKSKEQPPVDTKRMGMMQVDDDKNETYKNIAKDSIVATKQIFEEFTLIQDKLITAEWKLTNEYRTIAGFNCRRATTIIMDSLFIVAFYTDAITTQSGPEGLNGLPGMILGCAIPRLNLTYFATTVDELTDNRELIKAPSKGKKTDYKKLEAQIAEATKQWGKWGGGRSTIWGFML